MDLDEIFKKVGDECAAKTLKALLQKFLTPTFGALPKSQIDLIMLEALEEIQALSAESGVYELVSNLRVTRTKARNLIYGRELRKLSKEKLDFRVKQLLKRPIIQKSGDQFVLEVENPLVMDHLRDKVQTLGFVTDSSFSPNIVKLPLDALVALIEDYVPEDERKGVRNALIAAGAPDKSLKGILKAVLKKIAFKVASDTGEALFEKTSEYLAPIVDATLKELTEIISKLYQSDNVHVGSEIAAIEV